VKQWSRSLTVARGNPGLCFDAFSSREPVPISLENALDHDDFGLNQPKIMNVIDFKNLSGMRAENRFTLFLIPL